MKPLYDSLGALAQPIGVIWAALLAATLWNLFHRRWKASIFPGTLLLFIQVVGGTQIPARLLAGLERPYDPRVRGWPEKADAVVMLGGAHGFTTRSPLRFGVGEAGDRILLALEFLRTGRAKALVLGGSFYEADGQRRPDSELITAWARSWHLPVGELHLLGVCANTREEAQRTAQLADAHGWRRILLVSSGYHLARAEAVFRKAGLDVMPAGAEFLGLDGLDGKDSWRVVPRSRGFDLIGYWAHEQVGWLLYRWNGWV